MEFRYTSPLQKNLKMELPPQERTIAPFFRWAIHVLTIHRQKAILAMNYETRYCILLQQVTLLDKLRFSQPQVTCIMNEEVYYAVESSKSGTRREFFAVFRRL